MGTITSQECEVFMCRPQLQIVCSSGVHSSLSPAVVSWWRSDGNNLSVFGVVHFALETRGPGWGGAASPFVWEIVVIDGKKEETLKHSSVCWIESSLHSSQSSFAMPTMLHTTHKLTIINAETSSTCSLKILIDFQRIFSSARSSENYNILHSIQVRSCSNSLDCSRRLPSTRRLRRRYIGEGMQMMVTKT